MYQLRTPSVVSVECHSIAAAEFVPTQSSRTFGYSKRMSFTQKVVNFYEKYEKYWKKPKYSTINNVTPLFQHKQLTNSSKQQIGGKSTAADQLSIFSDNRSIFSEPISGEEAGFSSTRRKSSWFSKTESRASNWGWWIGSPSIAPSSPRDSIESQATDSTYHNNSDKECNEYDFTYCELCEMGIQCIPLKHPITGGISCNPNVIQMEELDDELMQLMNIIH
jgi:hypothetical protein